MYQIKSIKKTCEIEVKPIVYDQSFNYFAVQIFVKK